MSCRFSSIGFALNCALGLGAALVCSAQSAPDGYTLGTPWTGERGVRERTRDIMQREAAQPRHNHRYRIHSLGRVEFPELAEGTNTPVAPTDIGPQAAGGPVAQTVSTAFLAATFADCSGWPPDTMGVVAHPLQSAN